jgi:hypothetical protein
MGPQAILTALGKDGSISFLELKQVLPQIPHDADEELAISALSVVEEISEDFNAQIGKISHPVIQASLDDIHRTINSCIVSKGISSDSLQEIWRLTRSEFFSKDIATSITGAMNDSIFSMKDPRQHCLKNIKNLSSSIVHLQ